MPRTPRPKWSDLPAETRNRVLGYWRIHAADMELESRHSYTSADRQLMLDDAEAYRAAIAALRANGAGRKGKRK